MKILSSLFVGVLFAVSAHAAKVGDRVELTGTATTGGNSYPSALVLEITGLGTKANSFLVKTTTTIAGQSQTNVAERTAEEVGDEAQAAEVVANCAHVNGTVEEILIENGERLQTCKMTSIQGGSTVVINIAAVPFMIARIVNSTAGVTTSMTLKSYVRGQ